MKITLHWRPAKKSHRQEFDQALRNQQESMRATMGENFNDAMLDNAGIAICGTGGIDSAAVC